MSSDEALPRDLPPITRGMTTVPLKMSSMQPARVAEELGAGVFIGPNGSLLLSYGGAGLVLHFGSIEDIAHLRDILSIVHEAHLRREAFEAAATAATVAEVGHA